MLSDGEPSTPPLDGYGDEDSAAEEDVPLPSLKRRRKEEEDEEEEEDPFSNKAQPTKPAPKAAGAKGGGIKFSWGLGKKTNNSTASNESEEPPSGSEDSADEEPAEAPSPLAADASL